MFIPFLLINDLKLNCVTQHVCNFIVEPITNWNVCNSTKNLDDDEGELQ